MYLQRRATAHPALGAVDVRLVEVRRQPQQHVVVQLYVRLTTARAYAQRVHTCVHVHVQTTVDDTYELTRTFAAESPYMLKS